MQKHVLQRVGGDAAGGTLASAAGYIREAGGAQARQKTAQFPAEQIWRKVHQHVAKFQFAGLRNIGKNFATDRNSFLNDPHAIFCRERTPDRGVPGSFVRFPAERYSRTAVLIARFQDQVIPLARSEEHTSE